MESCGPHLGRFKRPSPGWDPERQVGTLSHGRNLIRDVTRIRTLTDSWPVAIVGAGSVSDGHEARTCTNVPASRPPGRGSGAGGQPPSRGRLSGAPPRHQSAPPRVGVAPENFYATGKAVLQTIVSRGREPDCRDPKDSGPGRGGDTKPDANDAQGYRADRCDAASIMLERSSSGSR